MQFPFRRAAYSVAQNKTGFSTNAFMLVNNLDQQ